MSGAKAAQREDRKKAKSVKLVQAEQLSQFVCESKALDFQNDDTSAASSRQDCAGPTD